MGRKRDPRSASHPRMSAGEVLTWIAFRDPRHEAWNFECTVAPLLLSLTPKRKRAFLEALKALTQEYSYCAVLLLPPHEKDQPPRYPCDELSPKGPDTIEDLRAQAEAFLQRSVTNQELRDCLEREDTARKRLGEAERELLEARSCGFARKPSKKTVRQAPLHGVRLSIGPEPLEESGCERHGHRPARGLHIVGAMSSSAGRIAKDGNLMRTLRDIGDFVGIPEGEVGQSSAGPIDLRITLKKVNDLMTGANGAFDGLSTAEQSSMRAMINALSGLPPIQLEIHHVETVRGSGINSQRAFLRIRIEASTGAVFRTFLTVFVLQSPEGSVRQPVDGILHIDARVDQVVSTKFLPQNVYEVEVTRTGVTSSGYTVLRKLTGHIVVQL